MVDPGWLADQMDRLYPGPILPELAAAQVPAAQAPARAPSRLGRTITIREGVPFFKAYFRRRSTGRSRQYRYYAAATSTQAYRRKRDGAWKQLERGRIDSRMLTRRPAQVDVALEFSGPWQRMQRGTTTTFSRDATSNAFFQALRNMLPPDRSALWRTML